MSAQEFDRWAAFAKFDHMWVFLQLPVYDQTCPVYLVAWIDLNDGELYIELTLYLSWAGAYSFHVLYCSRQGAGSIFNQWLVGFEGN